MSVRTTKTTQLAPTAQIASRGPTTTSGQSNPISHKLGRAGFTLVEILIVVAIISMVMALAMPAIEQVALQRVYSTCRQFIGTIRTIRNDSVLLNQVHRLAFDFDRRVYWVDQQKEFKLLETEATLAEKAKRSSHKPETPPSNFLLAQKFSKKPIPFPDGVSIDGVMKEKEGLKREGLVFIHFFPNGYNEPAIIYVNRTGREMNEANSLLIKPTSGDVQFHKGFLKDLEGPGS